MDAIRKSKIRLRINSFSAVIIPYFEEIVKCLLSTDIIFGDSRAEVLPVALGGVKCDLNFTVMPRENDAVLMAEFSTDLFKEDTVNEFISAYKKILESALDKEKLIKDISVLTEEEKHRILVDFNDTYQSFDEETCVYNLFEEQAEIKPDKIAVVFGNIKLTYSDIGNRICYINGATEDFVLSVYRYNRRLDSYTESYTVDIPISEVEAKFNIITSDGNELNIFKANLFDWSIEIPLSRNIHLVLFLSILSLGLSFFIFGIKKESYIFASSPSWRIRSRNL